MSEAVNTPNKYPKFSLRMEAELREKIEKSKSRRMSTSARIKEILDEYFNEAETFSAALADPIRPDTAAKESRKTRKDASRVAHK